MSYISPTTLNNSNIPKRKVSPAQSNPYEQARSNFEWGGGLVGGLSNFLAPSLTITSLNTNRGLAHLSKGLENQAELLGHVIETQARLTSQLDKISHKLDIYT